MCIYGVGITYYFKRRRKYIMMQSIVETYEKYNIIDIDNIERKRRKKTHVILSYNM